MTVVLVAGATGSLGSLIVKNLLERGATVRALVRPSSADGGTRLRDVAGHPRLSLRVGDLTDGAAALAPHLESVEVVVSAVQGGPEVIIDGQTELLRAAERAGVHRMIPSDFSINLWGYGYGVNILSDLRRTFAEAFRTSPVARTSVAIGAFRSTSSVRSTKCSTRRPVRSRSGATAPERSTSPRSRTPPPSPPRSRSTR